MARERSSRKGKNKLYHWKRNWTLEKATALRHIRKPKLRLTQKIIKYFPSATPSYYTNKSPL